MTKALNDFKIIDSRYKPEQWLQVSKKRLLLGIYIDYLFIGIIWALIHFALLSLFPDIKKLPPSGQFMLFGIYELLIFKINFPSLGATFLSIRKFKYQAFNNSGKTITGVLPYVNTWIKTNESWLSILIAIIFLNNGTKSIVRWTMWNPPIPFFGSAIGETFSIIVYLVMGAIEMSVAYFLLKLRMRAFYIGFPYLVLSLISTLMSWNLWDAFIAEMIVRRRNYQGLPVKKEMIDFFQSIVPEILVFAFALSCVLLFAAFLKINKIKSSNNRLHTDWR